MYITLQLSDTLYERLLSSQKRIEGSIGLTSPTEGNFNPYRMTKQKSSKYVKLKHGRVSVNDDSVCLTLRINLDEANVNPSEAMASDCWEATDFVRKATKTINN